MHPLPLRFRQLCWLAPVVVSLLAGGPTPARALDLSHAVVVVAADATTPEKKAAAMLVDEIAQRSRITLETRATWPADDRDHSRPVIAIGTGAKPAILPPAYAEALSSLPAPADAEGYRVQSVKNAILVTGNSPVAAVFGAGYLLRHLHLDADPMANRATVETTEDLRVATSPHHRIRGFQFNYRDWTNSYDGWTPRLFEQYVRDVAVFGANAIELMGPGPDNDRESPHFPQSKIDMLVEMSRITAEYGLQVWIFFPVWGSVPRGNSIVRTYADPAEIKAAVDEWAEVFRRMPQVDAVFAPGGDPGHTEPKYLLPLLEAQATSLRRFHPHAQMWVSPQEFDDAWMTQFLGLLKAEPAWLDGIAWGPWTHMELADFRARVPARYPIRLYPDIGHSTYCELPVPDWDPALMATHGREASNPRPMDMAAAFRRADPYNVGALVYSEGINDDVNKFIFSALDWDARADVRQILREYSRYFLGARLEESGADGILGLERNWQGPLLANHGVDQTFALFRDLERAASPALLLNWRFQQLLYRAYYDYYIKARLSYETSLQQQALGRLREAGRTGSLLAMDEATALLDQAVTHPIAGDLRTRLRELGAALFQSIRSQLSVDDYQAFAIDRGASLDSMDTPLNERYWLESRFREIRQGNGDELARLAEIHQILHRTDPGPGGFYDDLGDPANQPHLEGTLPFAQDPTRLHSPHNSPVIFSSRPTHSADAIRPDGPAKFLSYPLAWRTVEETRWDVPLTLHYPDLDRSARYRVRVVYYGWSKNDARIRLVANDRVEVHPWLKKAPQFSELEFDIPPEATASADLHLQWQAEPGGPWSGVMVCEVFLLRK